MNTLIDLLAVFVHSDVAGSSPAWWNWGSNLLAHIAMGMLIGQFWPRIWWIVFCAWVVKELLGDIPDGDLAAVVIADSIVDPLAGLVGFWLTNRNSSQAPSKDVRKLKSVRQRMRNPNFTLTCRKTRIAGMDGGAATLQPRHDTRNDVIAN
jgi:hypothetical protein